MSIVLVRHGETALNAARVMQPAGTPLSPRGQAQAELLAARLAATPVAAILSSDLPRARLTADALAVRTGLPVRHSALLQERNFGDLRGRPYDTLGFDPLAMADAPPGGESATGFEQRVQDAFTLMLEHHAAVGGDLVVVTHGLLIRTLLAGVLRLPAETMAGMHLGNTSVSIFDGEPPHALRLLNCTRHLDGALGDDARALSGG